MGKNEADSWRPRLSSESCSLLVRLTQTDCVFVYRVHPNCAPEQNPPIQDVIDAKVVPRFVEFLKADDVPLLQVRTRSLGLGFCFHVLLSGGCGF